MKTMSLCTGLLALILVSSCGQKGPLYLPKPKPTTEATKPASAPPPIPEAKPTTTSH